MLALPPFAFLKQIAFSVHQQNENSLYILCFQHYFWSIPFFGNSNENTWGKKWLSNFFLPDSTCFSYNEHFIVQKTLRIDRTADFSPPLKQNQMLWSGFPSLCTPASLSYSVVSYSGANDTSIIWVKSAFTTPPNPAIDFRKFKPEGSCWFLFFPTRPLHFLPKFFSHWVLDTQ